MSEEYDKRNGSEESATTVDIFGDLNRRDILKTGVAASAIATSGLSFNTVNASTLAGNIFGGNPRVRASKARQIRRSNAQKEFIRFRQMTSNFTPATNNSDESDYADFRGSFSKSLKHNKFGEVTNASYSSYLAALDSENPADFENILVGRENDPNRVRLVSPQAAFSYDQSAVDSNGYRIDDAPKFNSDETAAEMGELYWYALTRDIPFTKYSTNNLIQKAADDLNAFTRNDIFLQDGGQVTPETLFRGVFAGTETGPFVSQALLQPFNFGQLEVEQRYDRPVSGQVNDFMTSYDEWLRIQRGGAPTESTTFTGQKRFISCMRELAEFVHTDFPVQSPLYAFLIFSGYGPDAMDPNIPYGPISGGGSNTQQAFTTFGGGGLPHLVLQAPRIGLLGAWYQKWGVHRRLRPEAFAGRINNQLRGRRSYDINQEILDSDGLARTIAATESDVATNMGLLPMGYPEGSPVHPAYPGGHSTFAAAGATICKALFNEDFVIPNPVMANNQGSALVPYVGPDLTIGGELNKLVNNITHGRDGAGMHWRSDGRGNFIGENVAITLLCDYSRTYNDDFDGFQLTRFNGQKIRIVNGQILAN